MDEYEPLYSEEDVRTKVVTTWLADHGFGLSDISVEYSFEIRLGRKILFIASEQLKKAASQVFRSRADAPYAVMAAETYCLLRSKLLENY